MASVVRWLSDLGEGASAWLIRRAEHQADPETMIAAFIATLWAVLAGLVGGWLLILIMVGIVWTLHILAVESGNHVLLGLATSALLIVIVIASQATFGGLPPVLLAAAGATALGHSELVRLNYGRRRGAVVTDGVFGASGLGLALAAGIGITGVAAAEIAGRGVDRNWLWMPAAVAVLLGIGLALSIWPARNRAAPRCRAVEAGRAHPTPAPGRRRPGAPLTWSTTQPRPGTGRNRPPDAASLRRSATAVAVRGCPVAVPSYARFPR